MWAAGRPYSRRLCKLLRRSCVMCGRAARPLFVSALLLTVPGCCLTSSTQIMPTLPVLSSMQRLTLDGTPGVWMDSRDAGALALWIHAVTGGAE